MVEEHLLLDAGIDLLIRSGLLGWDEIRHRFTALKYRPSPEYFEKNGMFGRLISWILFSIGAEYVLKAVCDIHGVAGPRTKTLNVDYPRSEKIEAWAHDVATRLVGEDVDDAIVAPEFYGTLEQYVREHIHSLAKELDLQVRDEELLFAGFKLLTAIRNRDVHSYEKNVREANFYLVDEVFVPCLNILWDSLPPATRGSVESPPARS
jgi:hypothetical protein